MNNTILYSDDFKTLKWNDFYFKNIQIETFPILEDPKHYKNCFTFRDALLKAIETHSGKKIFKLLLITPDNINSNKFYAVAYSEDNVIFTVEIEDTPQFKVWYATIEDNENKNASVYEFSYTSYSSQPVFNLKDLVFNKNTGAFINNFIPNQFIAKKLDKEKTDFITPFIQLKAEINLEAVKQSFNALVAEKRLTINPPKNNNAIYADFEKEAGYPFPQLIKDFLTLHNGIDKCAIMSAEDIFKEWKQWKNVYNNWALDLLLDTYSTNEGKALLMYTTPYWIPFFDLENGNFLAFDFAPNTKGTAGQIIRFGADQDIGYIEANNLNALLKSLMGNEAEIEENEWFFVA